VVAVVVIVVLAVAGMRIVRGVRAHFNPPALRPAVRTPSGGRAVLTAPPSGRQR
jgi:hypothetical protein